MDLEEAVEEQMLEQADEMIDRMIPKEGLDTFGSPEGRALMGLADDLSESETSAFGDVAFDLDARGSDAFGDTDLDADGSGAFAGMGALGAIGLKSFAKKVKSIALTKANMAKQGLRAIAGVKQKATNVAKNALTRAKLTPNVFQRQQLVKQAKAAADTVAKVDKQAVKLAEVAVNPKVSRAEMKLALRPAVKGMAQAATAQGKKIMRQVAASPGAVQRFASQIPMSRYEGSRAQAIARKQAAAEAARNRLPAGSWWSNFAAMFGKQGMPVVAPTVMPTEQAPAPANVTTGHLSMGDVLGAEPDITDSWGTDEVYGDPLGF